jgi:hypothetical protein
MPLSTKPMIGTQARSISRERILMLLEAVNKEECAAILEKHFSKEFKRGWEGGFNLGYRLGSESKPAHYPNNLAE